MGAGSSKPEDASKHVFSSETPVRFSQELVDSLQASSETNSSRAKSLELHIAERVAAELEKIQKRESETFEAVRSKLSAPDSSPDGSSEPQSEKPRERRLLELPPLQDVLPSALTPGGEASKEEKKRQAQSSKKVSDEIEKLKHTLSERKVLKDLPPDVEKARNAVVSCLRVNDRRPLDCWKEVEAFKGMVGTMEEKFVGDIL